MFGLGVYSLIKSKDPKTIIKKAIPDHTLNGLLVLVD